MRFRKVRGAPAGSMNRAAYAHACEVAYNTVRLWEQSGRLRPHYAHFRGQPPRLYYLPAQVEELKEMRFWQSAMGVRLAKRLFKQRRSVDP